MTEILELLKALPYGGMGFASLVSLAIVLIFRGDIVPKSTVEQRRADWDAVVISKNLEIATLKEAYKLSEEARNMIAESDTELLQLARLTVHILEDIQARANGA